MKAFVSTIDDRYHLAGIDNRLFVSKYQLELPRKEDLQRFLEEKRKEMVGIE